MLRDLGARTGKPGNAKALTDPRGRKTTSEAGSHAKRQRANVEKRRRMPSESSA